MRAKNAVVALFYIAAMAVIGTVVTHYLNGWWAIGACALVSVAGWLLIKFETPNYEPKDDEPFDIENY